jgi:class 3 adenylate cyclase
MGVFGIPHVHEDDAVRAVRAAGEIADALSVLNDELVAVHGVRIETRTGVNTGEVMVGDPSGEVLVTGVAVNVAARLEQAAQPGDVLIGPETHRLVRDAVLAEPVEPLTLKGVPEPVVAYRAAIQQPRRRSEREALRQVAELLPIVARRSRRSGRRPVGRLVVPASRCRLVEQMVLGGERR